MHRFVDLFCGIGGFRVALEQEGMDCVFSCDIDDKVRDVYFRNFDEIPHGDITTLLNSDIPAHDILCAGFPCQPFSRSGRAKGFNDTRGRLFFEIVRIAKHHKPYILLLENVRNILTVDDGNVLRTIYSALQEIGYGLEHYTLNSSYFGVPQSRERVYFVALRSDSPLRHTEPKPNYRKKYLKDILLDPDKCSSLIVNRPDIYITRDEGEPSLQPIQIGYVNKGGQGERIYSANGHAITQSATSGGAGPRTGLYYVDGDVRKLHIQEAKSVMGFDKAFHVSAGLAGYSQLRNAVIPSMITNLYESVRIQ
ncbi:MAG: DNA (cytosine-5-)-methyltransferase [Gammaproteobacteria bacterium]|nr:DNA (cytosine-5-)-methyltransferase [Gammaproteobacteria bacterium]